MPTADEQVIVDGQRALAVSEVSGDFIYDGGATDIYCIVQKDGKAQRALKVANIVEGGGGGGGGSASAPKLEWFSGITGESLNTGLDLSNAKLIKVYKNGLLLRPNTGAYYETHTIYNVTNSGPKLTFANVYNTNTANSWTFDTRVRFFAQNATYPVIFGPATSDHHSIAIVGVQGKFGLFASSDFSGWDITGEATYWTFPSANSVYYIRCEFTGTQYLMKYKENLNDSWTTIQTVNSSVRAVQDQAICFFGALNNPGTHGFKGAVDINATKYTIDDNVVFDGATAVEGTDFINSGCTVTTEEVGDPGVANDYVVEGSTINFNVSLEQTDTIGLEVY